jgi:DNA primase
VLCLDGDAAGRKAAGRAALRALPILQPGRTLRFALLDGGKDPDDLVRQDGAGAIRRVIENASGLIEIIWQDALAEIDPSRPEERAALDKRLHELARGVADETVGRYVRDEFRARLRLAFAPARQDHGSKRFFSKDRNQPGRVLRRPGRPASAVVSALGEARLLYGCCHRPDAAEPFAERLALLTFSDPDLDRLRAALVAELSNTPGIDAEALLATLKDQGHDLALSRMHRSASRRPSALVGDAADAAEWLDLSIEAIEQRDADRSILERARTMGDDDDNGLAEVESDLMARRRDRTNGEAG